MRILAVDPGSKRVGLAVSDPTGTIAQPLQTLDAEPHRSLASRLAGIARDVSADRIVIGLPRRMDGTDGPEAKAARRLATEVQHEARLPVELVDERLTTVAAERSLRQGGVRGTARRQKVDGVAAALLLQSHLDRHR